jgi:hypothetical protein
VKPINLEFETGDDAWTRGAAGRMRAAGAVAAWLFVAASVGALTATGWHAWQKATELSAADDALRLLLAERNRPRPAEAAWQRFSPSQRSEWNQVARQLNTPWSALLDALELATPDDVAIVSIEPDGARGSVRVQAEAKLLDNLLAYVSMLKNTEPFESVVLIKHETNEQDANHPLRMSVDVRLKPGKSTTAPQEPMR